MPFLIIAAGIVLLAILLTDKKKPARATSSAGKNTKKQQTKNPTRSRVDKSTGGGGKKKRNGTRKTGFADTKKKSVATKKPSAGRTASGKVPLGRTLKTHDNYLGDQKKNKTKSTKERPVVVIEVDDENNLAVVPLSSRNGKDRTQLKNYQQGQSWFKHYIEIEDDEGNPIRVNQKFQENHPNMDISSKDVKKIKDKVLDHSRPSPENRKKIDKFRDKKG